MDHFRKKNSHVKQGKIDFEPQILLLQFLCQLCHSQSPNFLAL